MYRELGSLDAFGVPGGPYTGAPRTFHWHALPPAVAQRLLRCVAGEELPGPLLRISTRSTRTVLVAAALGLAALPLAFAWSLPTWMIPWPVALVFVSLFAAAGRFVQLASRTDRLPPGLYLFPLDVVETTRDTVRVSPFGSLRNAGIRRTASTITLELTFDHGARYHFVCADEAAAERAYAKIQEAHAVVERLTFHSDLEETVDLDPFFAIRGEPAWARAVSVHEEPRTLRSAIGLTVGMGAGLLAFVACAARADQNAYQLAYASHSEASYGEYLAHGGRLHRATAESQIDLLRERALARERDAEIHDRPVLDWRHRADSQLRPADIDARRTQQEEALNRYALAVAVAPKGPASSWSRNLHFGAHLSRIFEAARDHGDDRLYFSFERDGVAFDHPELVASLDAREKRMLSAFARVLSDTIPASLLVVSRDDAIAANRPELVLRVHETLTVRSDTDFDVTFDVTPVARGEVLAPPVAFSLRLPAPPGKLASLRPRSLFTVADAGPRHDVDLMTARAFDRLYDELYGLFFPGDPRVPLPDEAPSKP